MERTAQGIKPKQRLPKGNVAQKMPQKTWLTIYCNSTPIMPTNGVIPMIFSMKLVRTLTSYIVFVAESREELEARPLRLSLSMPERRWERSRRPGVAPAACGHGVLRRRVGAGAAIAWPLVAPPLGEREGRG